MPTHGPFLISFSWDQPADVQILLVKIVGRPAGITDAPQNYFLAGPTENSRRFLCLAWPEPQKGLRSEEMTTKATDIMICLDSSRSMLSVDFKPDNRFAVAKQVVKDFIQGREFDRIGLVIFAEQAITQCPLTLDRTALLNVVDQLQIGDIPAEQTAIGVGLATSVNRLKDSTAKSKVIILVTDGSNNAGTIDPITAAENSGGLQNKNLLHRSWFSRKGNDAGQRSAVWSTNGSI